jgi:hypothetical protein
MKGWDMLADDDKARIRAEEVFRETPGSSATHEAVSMRSMVFAGVVCILLAGRSAVAGAQTPALPWWASPSHNRGLTAHATYALSDGELGDQRAGALALGYARDRIRVTATVGRAGSRDDLHDGATILGANGSWRLKHLTRPAVSLDVQAGVGRASYNLAGGGEYSQLNLPLGVGAAFLGPAPIGSVELWLGGRVQLRRSSLEVAGSDIDDTNVGGGLSAGLEWTSLKGPGLHLGIDWLRIQSGLADGAQSEWTFGFGIHYRYLPPTWNP